MARRGYDVKIEMELLRRAESLDGEVVNKIAEVALKVAEPSNVEWTSNIVAITRQDGIADFVYVGDRVARLPWRRALAILIKDYDRVAFFDLMKVVRKEKVIATLKDELDQVNAELSKLSKRKSKYAMEMKAIYEKDRDHIIKTLKYLEGE